MSLQDRLMADLKDAMRSRDTARIETLRMARSAVKYKEIELQRDATDDEVVEVLSREARRRTEAIEMFRKGGRQDLVSKEEAELEILEEYLPEQMSEDEVKDVVQRIVVDLGATDMSDLGAVMRQAMSDLKGKADGRLVNQMAREILSQ